ncbi:hypothetical protein B0H16DRAFT_100797 [Mycena metata]|uniref:Protein kinase domain-containing protein n=1 Tax=Mycena metata TaxID=1033252 RepID=A0AAD7I9C7_9AGAR|nr:hypothetical protein B0H16DRAFT_100797 [Mycena metata]
MRPCPHSSLLPASSVTFERSHQHHPRPRRDQHLCQRHRHRHPERLLSPNPVPVVLPLVAPSHLGLPPLSPIASIVVATHSSKFSFPSTFQGPTSISREYLANRYRSLSPSTSIASSSAPSSVVSTPPSSPEPKSEHNLPNLEEGPTPRTTPSHLILEPTLFHSGHFATVYSGTFSLDNQPSSRIILKCYPTQYFPRHLQELDVYAALAPLAVIVPRLYTVLAPLDLTWAGLVLENAGTELGNSSQTWDEVDLTHDDRRRLYGALTELHSVGVVHGDLTPRNVVRRSRGALCLVDFGQSTLHHVCSGARCPELFALREALAL